MDPLSVTASIVGLLGATAKVSSLVKTVNGAPSLMQDVLSQTTDIRMSLGQLQTLLFGPEEKFRSRAALLMVEDLIALLTNAVMTFSELEKVMEQFKNDESPRILSRLKLALKEPTISKLLLRLQSSRASLSLMLTTLTCSSVEAAQASERQLHSLVQQLLESNEEISSRLANIETHRFSTAPSSIASTSQDNSDTHDDSSTIRPKIRVSNFSRKIPIEIPIKTTDNAQDLMKGFGFTFDPDLKASRVYMRVRSRDSNISCSSSVVPSMGLSFLSGLSLADISNISMLSLPISCNELWNARHYSLETTLFRPCSWIQPSNARDYTRDESTSPLWGCVPVETLPEINPLLNSKSLNPVKPTVGDVEDDKLKSQQIEDEYFENEDFERKDSENEVQRLPIGGFYTSSLTSKSSIEFPDQLEKYSTVFEQRLSKEEEKGICDASRSQGIEDEEKDAIHSMMMRIIVTVWLMPLVEARGPG